MHGQNIRSRGKHIFLGTWKTGPSHQILDLMIWHPPSTYLTINHNNKTLFSHTLNWNKNITGRTQLGTEDFGKISNKRMPLFERKPQKIGNTTKSGQAALHRLPGHNPKKNASANPWQCWFCKGWKKSILGIHVWNNIGVWRYMLQICREIVCGALAWVLVGRHVVGSPRRTWVCKFVAYTRYRQLGNVQIAAGDINFWQQLSGDFCAFCRVRGWFWKWILFHQALCPNGLPTGMQVQSQSQKLWKLVRPTQPCDDTHKSRRDVMCHIHLSLAWTSCSRWISWGSFGCKPWADFHLALRMVAGPVKGIRIFF